MVFPMRSWLAGLDSDTESGTKKLMLVLKLSLKSRPSDRSKGTAMRLLAPSDLGVDSIRFDREGTFTLVGHINPDEVVFKLRKNWIVEIVSVDLLTTGNDAFPATERITELKPIEDTDLGRKGSLGIVISEEQPEQSEKQGQANSNIFQVEASSFPLASEARPSQSPVSRPSQGTSDQIQAAHDHVPELSFPFAPSSSCIFRTKSHADMSAQSSIYGGACLPKDMNLMEEEGLGGHDQIYDSAINKLLSGISGIGELKRLYDIHAGEQASRLKEAEDAAIMLRRQVEELEANLSMANMSERHLTDMLSVSEDRHARTKRELALMREKMDEANHRIEYLEATVSRYQNRIVLAEIEKEEAEERACRASAERETMSAPCPSPPAPTSTSLSFVPCHSPCLADLEGCKGSALCPDREILSGQP